MLLPYYDILINIKFPFLYNPPNGIPPAAAAVSSTKFKLWDTCVNTTYELCIGFKYEAVEANDALVAVKAYEALVAVKA